MAAVNFAAFFDILYCMKNILLWLDDLRNPFKEHKVSVQYVCEEYMEKDLSEVEVIWVKTQPEFEKYINQNGLPDFISFDNDLGVGCGEGYGCAKWLVEYCMNNNVQLPGYYVHSANPVAKENIENYLNNFIKHTNQ